MHIYLFGVLFDVIRVQHFIVSEKEIAVSLYGAQVIFNILLLKMTLFSEEVTDTHAWIWMLTFFLAESDARLHKRQVHSAMMW